MGTQTLGSTAAGQSGQFWFEDTGSGVAVRGDNILTVPGGDIYVDAIHLFGNSEGGSTNANCFGGLFNTGNGLVATSSQFTLGTSTTYYTAPFAAGSYFHLVGGATFRGGILVKAGGGFRTWGRNDGGSWHYSTGVSSFPNPFNGTAQTGLGNFPWYVTYFPAATITGFKDPLGNTVTYGYVGERLQIDGLSFSAGVTAIDFNGTAADLGSINVFNDTGLNINVPAGATTGPVHVVTNAGTATSSILTIAGGRIERSGVLVNASSVRVSRSGVLVPITRIRAYRSGSLVDVH